MLTAAATAVSVAAPTVATSITAPVVAPPAPEMLMGLCDWVALRLDTFDVSGMLVKAVDWLRYMKRHFGALELTSLCGISVEGSDRHLVVKGSFS